MPYTKNYPNVRRPLRLDGQISNFDRGKLVNTISIFGGNPPSITLGGTKTGDYNPRFRDQIKRGVQAGTAFSASRTDYSAKLANATAERWVKGGPTFQDSYAKASVWGQGTGYWFPDPLPSISAPSVAEADNRALIEFAKKLREAQTQFSAGVFIGELRETLHAIRNPAAALRRGISSYHKDVKKRLRGARTPKAKNKVVANTWLEYSFGWRPLVADIEDGAVALARQNLGPKMVNLRAVGFSETALETYPTTVQVESLFRWRNQYTDTGRVVVIYRGAIAEDPSKDIRRAQLFGVRLEEFLPTVWELVPYSFLVDYFTNIGDMLEAYSYRNVRPAWCLRTVRTITFRRYQAVLQPNVTSTGGGAYQTDTQSGTLASSYGEKSTVSRTVYLGNFMPSFTWSIPGFSSKKWLNVGALLSLRR